MIAKIPVDSHSNIMCNVLCRYIAPTLVENPPLDSPIMSEEIFGPLLPIITVRTCSLYRFFVKSMILGMNFFLRVCLCLPHVSFFVLEQVKDFDAAIDLINDKPKPLAVYLFSTNKNYVKRFTEETSSGALVTNDCILQVSGYCNNMYHILETSILKCRRGDAIQEKLQSVLS